MPCQLFCLKIFVLHKLNLPSQVFCFPGEVTRYSLLAFMPRLMLHIKLILIPDLVECKSYTKLAVNFNSLMPEI